VRAQEVISAGMECVIGAGQAAAVRQS
jgi:hypothetical protein